MEEAINCLGSVIATARCRRDNKSWAEAWEEPREVAKRVRATINQSNADQEQLGLGMFHTGFLHDMFGDRKIL